ncbi:protocadherin Fat 2 isoform X2 [Kryptolebias marmoratus]|uniref:FAT atypical cadherin 2 n=1 Tax=Kryptolebias marmoratus TaxID=37003 RepID=A0A3Q2ZL37_KRYMA|nr:protocadherin Fat 2 isoform X2 [Kryptolebias marmoratus]
MAASGSTHLILLTFLLLPLARCHRAMEKEKDGSSLSFTHYLYNVTINENSAPRMYVDTPIKMGIQLTDPVWDIKYNIVSGDEDELFQAESLSVGDFCFLRIKTRSSNSALLNREVRDSYTLTVEAKESTLGFQAKTKVFVHVLDTNDLKPLFYPASYNVNLREDTPLKSSVVRVSATDADVGSNAEFYYSFTSRAHPFAVDPFTGTVILIKKLNHTLTQKYDLTVLAEDRTKKISGVQKFGNSARVIVNIQNVFKGAPLITPPLKPTVSADGNVDINAHVEAGVKPVESLNIVAGDPHNCFEVIPLGVQGTDFQVISTKRIAWSQSPFGLNLSLQAKDRSLPSLLSPIRQIHITANHYTPLAFLEDTYIVTLSEFSPPKTHVVKVSVTSFHNNVTFSIKSNPDSSNFKIHGKSGIIVTTKKFDYERKNRFEFDVVANHGEAETHIVVKIIDENDNSPQFKQASYQETVAENTPVGSSVLKVMASDIDKGKNGFVTYAIANSDPLPFTIDPFTGVISTSEHLDYELMKRRYHLRVWASDSGSPFSQVSECPVTITLTNMNDNIPLFERVDCNITVPLDLPVGHTIAELSAIDLDELQQLRYIIESGNELQVFIIDAVTGVITLKQSIPPQEGSFTLRVVAKDGKHHSEASVVRITVTNKGDDATLRCLETGILKQLTDKLIESIKPVLINQVEESFSDIHITNRHSPKFVTSIPSSIDIAENHPLNSNILQFKATDNDSGFNSKLVFAISSGNEDGCFSIDTFSGELYLVCPLDRESKGLYFLNITVYDLGIPQTSAWKFIVVNVIDVNDNPPVFDQPRYVIHVPENTVKDTVVFTCRAVDVDTNMNGKVQYSLLTSTDMFRVDELTGDVIVMGHLDRENSPRHDLWIKARDQAKHDPQLFSIVHLLVILQDINDNPPKFEPKVYHRKVAEDVPVGTLLVWVESIDLDLGSGGLVTYNLPNTEGGIFRLDSSTGALTLERELDFERRPAYNLTVRAVDHGFPRSLSSSCFVEIEVLDVNENLHKPVFTKFVYEATVMEDSAVGTSVVTLTASDKDLSRDGVVRYHISDGSGLGLFSIDEETGVIRTSKTLDREMVQHYWLSVYATDLGTEPLISWTHVFLKVLDVNDNAPELSQLVYFASVQENVDKVSSVIQVSASDVDTSSEGKLSFQMQESHKTFFNIDPKTGVISTHSALDREDKPEHSIEVVVSDNGSPSLRSTATVVIQVLDANDNQPKFTERLFQVKLLEQDRQAGRKEVCRMVAGDNDEGSNAVVTYELENSNNDGFQIDNGTGVVTVHGDFRAGSYNILTIKATDQGNPPRSSTSRLDVEWVPRPPASTEPLTFVEPHFPFAVMETDHVTHLVGIIMMETHQPLLWYDIIGGDEDKDFTIQRNVGTISIARRLDAARHSNYNLTVEVTDGHQKVTTQAYILVVDMNEHRPAFLKSLYEVRVPEDTSPWKDILQISAQDADPKSKLVFSIHSSLPPDSANLFHLDPKSGVLVMKEELDFETISVHTLIVTVLDQEIPVKRNFAKVVIQVEDCNDHSPAFLSPRYQASISNLAPAGSEVIRVKALDKDMGSNADISYSLHSGNIDNIFSIDSELGSISLSKPLDLHPQDQFHLTVKATDQGFPQRSDVCSVHIRVRISDQTPPTFPSEEYLIEVNESSPPGTPVITISASSPAAVHYGIESGNVNGTFYINPYTGMISTNKYLDFENCESYKLKVTASTTMGAMSKTLVHIYVVDDNDNAPVFQQTEYLGQISESAHINSMVMGKRNTPLVIQASDADRDSNSLLTYQILEPEALKIFKIDPSMGTISLISPVDFETKTEYHLTVQVKDSGEPSLYAAEPAKVIVRVLDLNDCPPQFTAPVYEPSFIFPVIRDTEVVRVTAHDADSAVSYSITEGNLHNAFSIHPNTGVITVTNVSEFRQFYQLGIRASDGLFKDSATVKINATKLIPSDFRFEQNVYLTNVKENLNMIKTLAALNVLGCYLNEPLVFSVINPMGKFAVSQTSGVLETTGIPFDREEKDVYDIIVKVQDMRRPPRTATAQVKVFIDDVNDNAPQFLNLPFSMMISEDTEPGDVLYQVTAIDKDLAENGSIFYSLEEDYGLFRIDPNVGDISLQRPLDFEALNKYELIVLASDDGEPSLITMAQLTIQVRNRTNPIFQTLLYPLKVPENVPPFTTILHVQARNPEGYRLIYNLKEENASKHFHIDFKTGVLTVINPLDFESQTLHVLTVQATDSVSGASSEASIEIEVEDVNDNAPVFSQLTYSVNIAEGLPINTSVIQLSATDKDSGRNKDLTYHIVKTEGSDADFFQINPNSGLIVTKQVLDHEDIKHFNLKIKAIDNGTVPLSCEALVYVNVTDVNDNTPDFVNPHYKATLDEMAKCGHIVIRIQASDPDSADLSNLKYKIISGNEDRYFNINESSGIISFSNVCRKNLDPYYNLTVAVSDGVFQKTAPVNIDMINSNKRSPYFKQSIYEAELAENAEPGTRVIRLAAIDPDDGPHGSVDYTIINKLADEKFAIHKDGQVVTTQPLDRENSTQRVIAIKVMAKDGGGKVAFCTVKIILTDENDNVPQFKATDYQVSIQSTVNKGSPVITVLAYDADDGKNGDVTYTVEEAEEVTEDIIEINPLTGVVSVKESLVGMENKIFNFKVKARDGSLPFYNSTVPVQMKVVPPEVPLPKFTEPLYHFSAAEDFLIGTEIGFVRADSDIPVIYSLVNGNTIESNKDKEFSIDKESGTLLLQKPIDYEKRKWYQVDVLAQGNHNGTDVASLVSVKIEVQDVNDNQPVFDASPYRAFLAENMPAGTTVIQVTANDPDTDTNGLVTYTLESLPDDTLPITEVFTIDGDSGWITTVQETDCEATRVYRFNVVATDHGGDVKLSSSVLVEVMVTDQNDNPPKFTDGVYRGSVVENLTPFEPIVSMTTTDADVSLENRLVTCYITDGDPLGQFAIIQEDEGQWGLIVKETLDRETKDRYTLKVTATDGKFEAPVTVDVHVLDINDNSPVCEQLMYTEGVMENLPPRMFVLKVSASDSDVGVNGEISYTLHGPDANKFHLEQRTGELFTWAALDREADLEYNLVVKATDGGGRSCQADVLLMIQDMNDNPPHFSTSHYEVTVFDNTTARTPISVIYATDADTGINSEVKYSLLEGDDGYFSLDEVSGVLRLERPLTSDTPPTFELKVRATDRGLPLQLYSVATVTVDVVSLDDYQPVFLSSEYTAQLPESLAVGSEVLSVSALTREGGGPDPIVYRIISGNEDGRFLLDSRTGLLTLVAPLDFEVFREYYLSVEGSRGKSSLSDITTIIINVTDANDNPPVFAQSVYSTEISEDLTPGSLVMTVTANDLDGPINNLLRYSIVSGDVQQQFSIHPRSGEITVRTALDREEIPHYSLTVQAADEGNPPLLSAVLITITVLDVNDNKPVFSQVNHNLYLQEGESIGSSILQLVVKDRDTPKNGPPFSFHIISGNNERRFHVDQGGLLSLSAPLRKKTKPFHQLKIQVTDSGHPPLSSICVVNINVTEQSKYPPSVVPLEVFITTAGGLFANRVIGRLHASDQDLQDILTYKLVSENPDGKRFSIDSNDGRIWADEHLEGGSYALNVSVSDGKFSVWAGVRVHLWEADQRALDSGLTLQLDKMSPEEFLADQWRGLQRSLAQALTLPRQEIHLASLQQLPHTQILEVLLVWRPQDQIHKALPTSRLSGIMADMEDSLSLSILRVSHNGCLGAGCPPRGCRNAVLLSGERLNHFTTARAGYITPQHTWESVCACNESALRFDSKSYLKFLPRMDEDSQEFRLTLRFKTFQQQGLIMSTNGPNDWGVLQLTKGELHFRYRCGNLSPKTLLIRSDSVSDGRWHDVLLEVNTTSLKLTLDQQHPASIGLMEPCRMMRFHGALLFAPLQKDSVQDLGRDAHSFIGCLEGLKLNGEPIAAAWTGSGSRRVFGVYQCCSRTGGCDSQPCENGGICREDAVGEPHCSCVGLFHGERCELADNPCASQPCSLGRVCVPKAQGYMCNCSTDNVDARCHNEVEVCSPNHCAGGFDCKVTEGTIHCDPLPLVSPINGYIDVLVVCAGVLGLVFLVGIFVCIRMRYVRQKKKMPVCVQDSNGLTKSLKADDEDSKPVEMNSMVTPTNNLDHPPFRSLRPCSQIGSSGSGSPRTQGPVVCSVAPNLPARPPSSSDNGSIRKGHWDREYEVYPADPDYYGRPTVQEFPQFDIVEDSYSTSTVDSRRNSRFGGFPFPLDRCDRRAPLPPCYSNQNLDDFLGPDGLPLPSSQCPNEYTAISYYPTQHTRSLDNVTGGYKRLSMRLSVAMPSYAEQASPPSAPNAAQPQTRAAGQNPCHYDGTSMVGSDYGSCEEVMF